MARVIIEYVNAPIKQVVVPPASEDVNPNKLVITPIAQDILLFVIEEPGSGGMFLSAQLRVSDLFEAVAAFQVALAVQLPNSKTSVEVNR